MCVLFMRLPPGFETTGDPIGPRPNTDGDNYMDRGAHVPKCLFQRCLLAWGSWPQRRSRVSELCAADLARCNGISLEYQGTRGSRADQMRK